MSESKDLRRAGLLRRHTLDEAGRKALESLSPKEQAMLRRVLQEVPTTTAIEEDEMDRGIGDRFADSLASACGSWTFILTFAGLLIFWMAVNVYLYDPFDPFPFVLLNLALSSTAAFQAPIIMMSQNRQSTKDRRMADRDLELSIKTELHAQRMLEKLDAITRMSGFEDKGQKDPDNPGSEH